ncbi:MAG: hypothetical protein ACHREM_07905 [Polyangiales bacterium]
MKRAFPNSSFILRALTKGAGALGILFAGVALSSVASSQVRRGAAPRSSAVVAAADTSLPFLPPADLSATPAGVTSVIKPPNGQPVMVMTKSYPPAAVLGSARPAAAGSSTTATPGSSLGGAPPISSDQAAALVQLQTEADSYRHGAATYAKAVSQVIRQRFEQKRRTRLASLQESIDRETTELRAVRLETIERLKAFLAKFPDVPERTPDAMFRLASLYEEQALENDIDQGDPDYDQKIKAAYQPAEFLYRDIIAKFAGYSNRSSVQFFLGALLADTGRSTESQYVWRAMVCANHYSYPLAPPATKAEEREREKWKDGIPPAPQDHDAAYWDHWRNVHDVPAATPDPRLRRRPGGRGAPPPAADTDNATYKEIYPDDCVPLDGPQAVGAPEPRYVAQAWYRLAEYHFNRQDEVAEETGYFGASPYQFNRAYSAYQHAIKTSDQTVKVFSMYRVAWTLFKQQRYTASRNAFISLLQYFEDTARKGDQTGDQQMRDDAFTYIASALTFLDMEGPGPNEAYLNSREDDFSKYSGAQLEEKLEIAIDRVQTPTIVPQDKPWTIKVYKGLAAEFESDELQKDAVKAYELVIKKWPCDSEAPQYQAKIAELDDLIALKADSQADKDEYKSRALDARTKLLAYVGKDSDWVKCNASNPDAIHAAEALMSKGVKVAASVHTQLGRTYYSKATGFDPGSTEYVENMKRSREEYRLAEKGWAAYLAQEPDGEDNYDTRFWIADSRDKSVITTRLLKEPLDPVAVDAARQAAVDVRDSNLGDQYLRYAAYFAVDVYDKLADEKVEKFRKLGCVAKDDAVERPLSPLDEPGDACRPEGDKDTRDPDARRVFVREIPTVVVRTLQERDEYVAKVPASLDADKNAVAFQKAVADTLFAYGHFQEASPRYEALWHEHCHKDDIGFDAWYRLAYMSTLTGDGPRALELVKAAKADSCTMNADQKLQESSLADPTIIREMFRKAYEAMQAAEKETDPKARDAGFRDAAAKYEYALKTAPSRPEAPEGAINAAYCYKQVNEYKRAAEVYRLFLDKYGREEDLVAYRDGDPKKGIKRDQQQFKDRLKFTKQALDELGRTYLQAFDYASAAKLYDEIAGRTLLEEADRRDPALTAVTLQANLGNREAMHKALTRYLALHPSPTDKAFAEFTAADFEFKLWKQKPSDAAQRGRALAAVEKFFGQYQGNTVAARYVVDAAYEVATMRKFAGDAGFRTWYTKTSAAFATFKSANKEAIGSTEADYGAEAAYFFTSEKIDKLWDSQPGQPPKIKYEGTAQKVLAQLDADNVKRDELTKELEDIIGTYLSPRWTAIVYAREGSIFDTQRSALVKAKVEVIDPALQAKISKIEGIAQKILDDDGASEKAKAQAQAAMESADKLRSDANDKWKALRQKYLDAIEMPMIDRYTRAYVRGKQFDVKDPLVTKAVQRLAYYTDQLDDTKIRGFLANVEKDFSKPPVVFQYRDQMFKQARPGGRADVTTDVSQPTPTPDPKSSGTGGGS